MEQEPTVRPLRFLDLRPDCLRAPSAGDVAVLAAWMLWPRPEDEVLRRDARATIETWRALNNGNYPSPQSPAEHRLLVDLILTTPRMDQYADAMQQGFKRGVVAGRIVFEAVRDFAVKREPVQIGSTIERIAAAFTTKTENLSAKTINNRIWRDYRCVAPYWAALGILPQRQDQQRFPCAPHKLGQLLAMADDFRRRGEITKLARRSAPLLRKGETILVPRQIDLPRGQIRFEPLRA